MIENNSVNYLIARLKLTSSEADLFLSTYQECKRLNKSSFESKLIPLTQLII